MPLSASDQQAVGQLDGAIAGYLAARGDVPQRLQAAVLRDPDLIMAQCLSGYLAKLAGDAVNARKAAGIHAALRGRLEGFPATDWERGHVEALGAWVKGDIEAVERRLEALLDRFPTDVLALRMLHYLYFYDGDPRRLRDSVARRFHHYPQDHPYRDFVMGMLAFGLEEAGNLAAAERFARAAVEANPGDLWAAHAMAHVLETQGRWQEGLRWVRSLREHWAGANNFRHHLYWHEALYHLGACDLDGAMAVYDEVVAPSVDEDFYLNLCNAASLLLRLQIRGCAVGDRWEPLAGVARRHVEDRELVFASLHYLMPLVVLGAPEAERLLATLQRWSAEPTSQGRVAAWVGVEAGAFLAAACGLPPDPGAALSRFRAVRYRLPAIGGSHAQRDLFPLLARHVAERAGLAGWVRDFDAERILARS
jgi:tetratricopeptide (TPR) repeat protein